MSKKKLFLAIAIKYSINLKLSDTNKESRQKKIHQTADILLAILDTMGRRMHNGKLVSDIDESDACVKCERNPFKKKEVIACQ